MFKVQDKITVCDWNGPIAVRFINKIVQMKHGLKIIDAKGCEWNENGTQWRSGGIHSLDRTWMRHQEEGDVEQLQRRIFIRRIESFRNWAKVSTEDLSTMEKIIGKYKK